MTIFRSTPAPARASLQAMLDRDRAEWLPAAGERWEDFVARKAPPAPSYWSIVERAAYKAALEEAFRRGEARASRSALLFPLWIGTNEDGEPRDDAWERRLVGWSEGAALFDIEIDEGPSFWARAELTVVVGAFVVMARGHAPDVSVTRIGPYAVADGMVRAIVDSLEACVSASAVPKPSARVPAFTTHVAPAIELDALPPDVTQAIDAAVARFTLDAV
jgi:hypothetical protein